MRPNVEGLHGEQITLNDEEFYLLNEVIEAKLGLCFPEHKRAILEARPRPRIQTLHLSSFMDYYLLLQSKPDDEVGELAKLATNNETYFFRERGQFESLVSHAIGQLEASLAHPGKLRVLCAGCSSGEEAYTLNFYFKDHHSQMRGLEPHIDAFDIDGDRLGIARRSTCRQRSLREMTDAQISKYLTETESDRHEVRSQYRAGVNFSLGNIIDVETFQRPLPYDVVFCRNVLIYFSDAMLRRAIDNFAEVLRPGGFLFLGHSESIIGMTKRLETVRVAGSIVYRRVAT
ncbi:MAG: hypothetical protein IID05_11530 [Gemmatimonadetes bacterium]|nr:hypothetical protein [Gemmatimonadota bacterium]